MRLNTFIFALVVGSTCISAQVHIEPNKQAVEQSVTEFTNDFLGRVAPEKSRTNLVSSPLSIYIALSMAAYGAGGRTSQQMIQGLKLLGPSDRSLQLGIEGMVADLQKVENVTLKIANAIYVAAGWTIKTNYKQLTSDIFKSEVAPLNTFDPKEAAKSINSWVEQKTNKKIKDIVSEGNIDSSTRMILLNAVYFKGNWLEKFEKSRTKPMFFRVDQNNKKKVPTMHIESDFVYGYSDELRAQYVVLPYENTDFKMIIFIPKDVNGLGYVEANFRSFDLNRLFQRNGGTQNINLFLPRFKIESDIDLEQTLKQLGMTDMFLSGTANFSGITDEKVHVTSIRHKAFIEVNEEGSEAAGVTALEISIRSGILQPKLTVKVDRPFYFAIVHKAVPIFTGHVVEPESGDLEEPSQGGDQTIDRRGTHTEDDDELEEYPLVSPTGPINLYPQWSESTSSSKVWSASPLPTVGRQEPHKKLDGRDNWPKNPSVNSLDSQSFRFPEKIREFYAWFTERGHCPRFICLQ